MDNTHRLYNSLDGLTAEHLQYGHSLLPAVVAKLIM